MNPKDAGEVLITGCSSGIGRALAVEFASRGYRVLATARRLESLNDLAARGIATAALDVTDAQSIAALGLGARSVGILINNAGYGAMGPILDVPSGELRTQFETNVVALHAMVAAVAPGMIARGKGRIVNISSVSGVLTTPFAGAYCASKAAVNSLSDAMRVELAPFGVDVITIQPGAIRSSFADNASKADVQATSVYAPIAKAVAARASASQRGAMAAERFAAIAADAILHRNPRAVVRIGPHSTELPFIARWIPQRLRDRLLTRRSGLSTLADGRA